MRTEDIRGVLAVADLGHVGAAADGLGISQPALSRRIQRVEAQVGAPLFERTGRALHLNETGRAFVPHARELLFAADAARGAVARHLDPERGTVRLDFMHSLGTWMVPDLIRDYRRAHPHVQFALHQGAAQELVARVRSGESDIALVGPRPEGLPWQPLRTQALGLAVPEGHWAAGRDRVELKDFADEPFIGMLPGYGTRMLLDGLASAAGFTPRLVFESMELTTVVGLVAAGLGCALLPLDDPYLRADNLIPLYPPAFRELGMVWAPGAPAAERFRQFVVDRASR